jgi:hypothetical protein
MLFHSDGVNRNGLVQDFETVGAKPRWYRARGRKACWAIMSRWRLRERLDHHVRRLSSTSTASTAYLHPDYLGGTNVATHKDSEVVQTLDFYPTARSASRPAPSTSSAGSSGKSDLLPVGPAAAMRVLVVHSGSGSSMVAGDRRSWSGWRSRSPADRRCAASGVRPPWAELEVHSHFPLPPDLPATSPTDFTGGRTRRNLVVGF